MKWYEIIGIIIFWIIGLYIRGKSMGIKRTTLKMIVGKIGKSKVII